MKKNLLSFIIVIALLAIFTIWGVQLYNKMVTAEEAVVTQWANVEGEYQRRNDLIPNLVSIVKGYAAHETQTLQSVVEARANATKTVIDPSNMTEEELQNYLAAQGEVSSAVNRLLMVVENYPDLKANQNFLKLQDQLEGTENRIRVERQKYNETVNTYNTFIRRIPQAWVASIAGFTPKVRFAAEEGTEKAPEIQF